MENLKGLSDGTRQLIAQAAETLQKETGATAVLLTGPHALGLDRAEDKFYFVSITEDPEGVIEHRFAERYAGIERQMEIGIFPRKFIEKLVKDGYWDMVSLRAAEVLRIAVPLFDPTGYGRAAAEAMTKYLPGKQFISGKIHGIKATFDDAVSLYSKGDYAGAILVVREALRLAVELLVKQSPEPDLAVEEVVKARLGEQGYTWLRQGLGIDGVSEADLSRQLDRLIDLSRRILKDLGIADEILDS
ncbi:MAG: hypothetical protein V1694_08490 [Candidatus Eisenbacteria bacterium]